MDEVVKVLEAMGLSSKEKVELVAYQLNDLAHVWYEQWKEERLVREGPISWSSFKTSFLCRFFPLELRERKMQEFINIRQGSMSVKDYRVKFTQLSKHVPTMAADAISKINKFVMGISNLVINECRWDFLIPSMDIFPLMVHAKEIEEKNHKQVCRDLKRTRAENGNHSKTGLEF